MAASKKPAARKTAPKGDGVRTAEAPRKVDAFIAAYARHGNATQAAKDAGYSERSARQQGGELMTKPDVSARCAESRNAYLAEQEDDKKRQRRMLVEAADDAIRALQAVVRGGDASGRGAVARVSAATAILDRAGHKPVDESKIDHRSADGSMTPKAPTTIVIEGA